MGILYALHDHWITESVSDDPAVQGRHRARWRWRWIDEQVIAVDSYRRNVSDSRGPLRLCRRGYPDEVRGDRSEHRSGNTLADALRRSTPTAEQDSDLHLEAPCGYRARPLIGIWATPQYLHNGSVRTIFDLLSDTRPTKFSVGGREYDPVKLGYTEDPSPRSFAFDTSIPGNSNAGHWWTDDTSRPGRIGPKLADADKYAIIEFLKAATYDNYPSEKRDHEAIMPCQGQQNWALKK
jgi:hypothetical protein